MRSVLGLVFVCVLSAPASAEACASCGCGDPTLTVMGAEAPFAGRLRVSSELRYRWDRVSGPAVDDSLLHEARLTLGVAGSPVDWLTLSATMPVSLRSLRRENLWSATTIGPGEAEVRARVVLLRDRRFAPSHLLGAVAGWKLPTSLDQVTGDDGVTGDGRLLPVDVQTGSGTWDPILGLAYAHFADPWSVFVSGSVSFALAGRYGEAPGPSARLSVAAQHRLASWVTLRAGLDLRADAPATIGDATDPDSSHLVLFASPDVLFAPASDWVIRLGVRIPVLQRSAMGRAEGLYVLAGVVVDLEAT